MAIDLNSTLRNWLDELESQAPDAIEREIENRVEPYRRLGAILSADRLDLAELLKEAKQCTLMTEIQKWAQTPLTEFFDNQPLALKLISRLVHKLPKSDAHVAVTIDATIDEALAGSNLQKAQLGVVFSLVLTTAHPNRFVDYPAHKHWENFAKRLRYGLSNEDTYGHRLVWASGLAKAIAQTEVFQSHWPRQYQRFQQPLWIVSALSWANKALEEGWA